MLFSTYRFVANCAELEFHFSSGAVADADVNLPVDAVVVPIATLSIAPVVAGLTVTVPVPVGLTVIV